MCAEILVHAMIAILVKLKAENKPELLTTWLMNSQYCEMYFKALRSYTPVGSTMKNFNLLEVIDERGPKVKQQQLYLYFIKGPFENNYIVLTNYVCFYLKCRLTAIFEQLPKVTKQA
jgi:hypothetical protein